MSGFFLATVNLFLVLWNSFTILVPLTFKKKKKISWDGFSLCENCDWGRLGNLSQVTHYQQACGLRLKPTSFDSIPYSCTCARYRVILNWCCGPYSPQPKGRLRNLLGLKERHTRSITSARSTLSSICSFWQYIPLPCSIFSYSLLHWGS